MTHSSDVIPLPPVHAMYGGDFVSIVRVEGLLFLEFEKVPFIAPYTAPNMTDN